MDVGHKVVVSAEIVMHYCQKMEVNGYEDKREHHKLKAVLMVELKASTKEVAEAVAEAAKLY